MGWPGSGADPGGPAPTSQRKSGDMSGRRLPRQLTVAAGLIGLVCAAASCSASSSPGTAPQGATSASRAAQTMTSQVACERFYAFDLARRTNAADGRQTDDAQAKEALRELLDLASSMAMSVGSAVTVRDLPPKARVNAARIVRGISLISSAGGDVRDMSGGVATTIGKSADRIEKICIATNHPVPEENTDARE